ncbi:unnamed protein product [Enterobius vermicularis]|uniref:Flocculation protein FLO11-like n=1 Tax=Enterobius vermicularis TaxID=51028 RepID=A0A0N4VR16_ENTVE|nr:unnamed protein product [Enterobius vermicularis]
MPSSYRLTSLVKLTIEIDCVESSQKDYTVLEQEHKLAFLKFKDTFCLLLFFLSDNVYLVKKTIIEEKTDSTLITSPADQPTSSTTGSSFPTTLVSTYSTTTLTSASDTTVFQSTTTASTTTTPTTRTTRNPPTSSSTITTATSTPTTKVTTSTTATPEATAKTTTSTVLVKETVAMENATKPLKSVIVTETKQCVTIKILLLEAALFHKTEMKFARSVLVPTPMRTTERVLTKRSNKREICVIIFVYVSQSL